MMVGDTDMFSPPTGGVREAYAIRPYMRYMPYIKIRIRFPNGVHISVGDTAMFFEWGICFGWEYGHVFATHGWRLWGVCNTPLHVLHVIHRNTNVFFERGTRYPSKYECVSRTGCTLRIEIRKCFSNRTCVTHQNTAVFFEPGVCFG